MAKKLDSTAQEQIAQLRAQQKAEKLAAKEAKKTRKKNGDRGEGRWAQIRQVFTMTREAEPSLPWIMLAIIAAGGVVGAGVGLLLAAGLAWITWLVLGLIVGLFVAMLYMNRRAERVAFRRIEGRPGAVGAALSVLGRGWIVKDEPIAISPRHQDLVFMAIGRAGVVLVTEGPTTRVRQLSESARRDISRVVKNVPVSIINAGQAEDQVSLPDVKKKVKALPKAINKTEIAAVDKRLSTLRLNQPPIPKGIDPNRMRPNRKAMRGR